MRTYLSVDVDYWLSWERVNQHEQLMNRFFNRLINLSIPIYVVKDHEELVEDIDQYDWSHLINIDSHSDICCCTEHENYLYETPELKDILDFNCGTWANFVHNRKNGTFIWQYPRKVDYEEFGYCHGGSDPDYLWDKPWTHNWRKAKAQMGIRVKWSTVVACGVALSPEWLPDGVYEHFAYSVYPKLLEAGAEVSWPFKEQLKNDAGISYGTAYDDLEKYKRSCGL